MDITNSVFVRLLGKTLEHRLLDFFLYNRHTEFVLSQIRESGFNDAFNGSERAPRLKERLYKWWQMGILVGYDLNDLGTKGIDNIKFSLNLEDQRVKALCDFYDKFYAEDKRLI